MDKIDLTRLPNPQQTLAVQPSRYDWLWPDWLTQAYALIGMDEKQLINNSKSFSKLLDRVEKIPFVFSPNASETQVQNDYLAACLATAKVVEKALNGCQSPGAQKQWHQVAQKVASLKYRMEAANGGLDRNPVDPQLKENIRKHAAAWKKSSSLFVDQELSARDLAKIEEMCTYSEFAKILLVDADLRDRFFSWAIRDNNGVSQFVEFPATSARIKSALLAARIGRLGGTFFRLEKKQKENAESGTVEKTVSLPFFIDKKMQFISILDESKELVFSTGRRETIKKVLDIFANKNRAVGDFEMFGTRGIDEWNSHELGRWNPETKEYDRIDLTVERWWEQLPVLEEVDKKTLEDKYTLQLASGEWLVCGKSSRQSSCLDLDAMHGFMEVAIPTEDGKYRIYPFGNFASEFPHTTTELLLFLVNTVHGRIAYPDENFFYSNRQIASYPMKWSPEKGLKLMRTIGIDLIRARYNVVVFGFGGENCAYWSQKTLQSVDPTVPNLYLMNINKTAPKNPVLSKIFTTFRQAPEWMQPALFKGLDTAFLSHRGITIWENGKKHFKTHQANEARNATRIYHPGYLHEQILKGILKGIVTFGH